MKLSEIFDLQAKSFPEIFKIPGEKIESLNQLIKEPLVKSAATGRNTLVASVDFFVSLENKNLAINELVYLSFMAGAGFGTIVEQMKQRNAESV